MTEQCVCCGKAGRFSIILAAGDHGDPSVETERYYIPNQGVREEIAKKSPFGDVAKEVWFCGGCMRTVEDNLRATILYLQSENGRLAIKPTDGNED